MLPPFAFSHRRASVSLVLAGDSRKVELCAKHFFGEVFKRVPPVAQNRAGEIDPVSHQYIEYDIECRRLDGEPPYSAFRRVDPLKQVVERKSPLCWYDEFTVKNIIAFRKSNGGGSDFRKVATEILPRLGPHCRDILIAAQKTTEAIPLWFILPMAAAWNFADCPSFHRLRKRYRPARHLSSQGLLNLLLMRQAE